MMPNKQEIEKDLRGRTDPHELLPSQLITTIQRITKQRYQLAADNQRLREALRSLVGFAEMEGTNGIDFFEARNAGIALLAATPADSLETYRRKVLNEAADAVRWECEVYSEFKNENPVLIKAAEVIRRMAGKE